MSHDLLVQFRRWFEHEQHAHRLMLEAFDAAPDATRAHPAFQQALDIAAHIVAARAIWLSRIGRGDKPDALFPRDVSLNDVQAGFEAMHAAWQQYLDEATPRELAREFEYAAAAGGRYRSRIDDTLAHLFAHSAYHRGQVALLMRQAGATPAVTDYIFWSRR